MQICHVHIWLLILLNIVKNKNIPASIKSELSFKNGKLISLKDVILKTNNDIYKIQSVLFNDHAYRQNHFKKYHI